jgi:hypothetical protein
MERIMEAKGYSAKVSDSNWVDPNTFLVEFEGIKTTDKPFDEGDTEVVCVEFQSKENKCVLYKQCYNKEGDYIDHDCECFTPYQKAMYITMARYEYKRANCGEAWEKVMAANDYKAYDTLMDQIREYYSDGYDGSVQIVDVCNKHFVEMIAELNKIFHKNG